MRWLKAVASAALFASNLIVAKSKAAEPPAATSPNVVLIFCDDMGYGDIHPFGSQNPTPNLDRMASEGMRFDNFFVGQAVCTASRAALMTGCYPNRVGLLGALMPTTNIGINSNEFIMPKMFKSRSY